MITALQSYSQSTPSFQGKLILEPGLKLPIKKLNEAAKIFETKTKGLPDIKLTKRVICEENDPPLKCIDIIVNNDNAFQQASEIITLSELNKIIKNFSPEKISKIFKIFAKRGFLMDSIKNTKSNIAKNTCKLIATESKINILLENGKKDMAERYSVIANDIKNNIEKLNLKLQNDEEKLSKMRIPDYLKRWIGY